MIWDLRFLSIQEASPHKVTDFYMSNITHRSANAIPAAHIRLGAAQTKRVSNNVRLGNKRQTTN